MTVYAVELRSTRSSAPKWTLTLAMGGMATLHLSLLALPLVFAGILLGLDYCLVCPAQAIS